MLPLRHKKLGKPERARLVEEAVEAVGLDAQPRPLPVAAVGRHAAARGDRAGAGLPAGDPADGRAVRVGRRADARRPRGPDPPGARAVRRDGRCSSRTTSTSRSTWATASSCSPRRRPRCRRCSSVDLPSRATRSRPRRCRAWGWGTSTGRSSGSNREGDTRPASGIRGAGGDSLVATGCGDDERAPPAGGTPPEPQKVKIGLIPIADVAPVFVGIDRASSESRIELELQFAAGGAAITPGGAQRRLRHRLLQHGVAADRRLEGPAGADRLPGRPRPGPTREAVGRRADPQGQRHQEPEGPRGDRRSRPTRSTTSARVPISAMLEK